MRFVVLHHTGWPGHPDHYDLLLEVRSGIDADERALAAYATVVDTFPCSGSVLKRIADHRRMYLQYEGPVSAGRGQVIKVDEGEWSGCGDRMLFQGQTLRGEFVMLATSQGLIQMQRA